MFDDGRIWKSFTKTDFLKLSPFEHPIHLAGSTAIGYAFVKMSNVLASGGQPLDLPGGAFRGQMVNYVVDVEHSLGWTVYLKFDPEKIEANHLRTSTPPLASALHVGARHSYIACAVVLCRTSPYCIVKLRIVSYRDVPSAVPFETACLSQETLRQTWYIAMHQCFPRGAAIVCRTVGRRDSVEYSVLG